MSPGLMNHFFFEMTVLNKWSSPSSLLDDLATVNLRSIELSALFQPVLPSLFPLRALLREIKLNDLEAHLSKFDDISQL